jgi:hypothetical protein
MSSERLNIGVLVTARQEYMRELKKILGPLLLEGFIDIYEESVETQRNLYSYEYFYQFQIFLNAIKNWNQTILIKETRRIMEKCPFMIKIVSAILISNIKIFSSIRLNGSTDKIELKVPPEDIFIHRLYIDSAKEICENDDLLTLFSNIHDRHSGDRIKKVIEDVIEESVNSFIPVQSILEEYLSGIFESSMREPEAEPRSNYNQKDDDTISTVSSEEDDKDKMQGLRLFGSDIVNEGTTSTDELLLESMNAGNKSEPTIKIDGSDFPSGEESTGFDINMNADSGLDSPLDSAVDFIAGEETSGFNMNTDSALDSALDFSADKINISDPVSDPVSEMISDSIPEHALDISPLSLEKPDPGYDFGPVSDTVSGSDSDFIQNSSDPEIFQKENHSKIVSDNGITIDPSLIDFSTDTTDLFSVGNKGTDPIGFF